MTTHLLDANVLIALTVAEHEHHDRAAAWAADHHFALCPIVEGALVRFLVRIGESHGTATAVLTALHASGRCDFWPDSLSYADTDLRHVTGHRQVADAYLVALADSRDAKLATFDRRLAVAAPTTVELLR